MVVLTSVLYFSSANGSDKVSKPPELCLIQNHATLFARDKANENMMTMEQSGRESFESYVTDDRHLNRNDVDSQAYRPVRNIDDLHQQFQVSGKAFNLGFKWSHFVAKHASSLSPSLLQELFRGWCPVSGNAINHIPGSKYHFRVSLPRVSGGTATGIMNVCCWPCVCDAYDWAHVDTKTLETAEGPREYHFLVIGDPCAHEKKLHKPFNDPFGGHSVTLAERADLQCHNGHLQGALYSDGGYLIMGMLFPEEKDSESLTQVQQHKPHHHHHHHHHDHVEDLHFREGWTDATQLVKNACVKRKATGYDSGMGLVFQKLAKINPINNYGSGGSDGGSGGCDDDDNNDDDDKNDGTDDLPAWAAEQSEVAVCPGEDDRYGDFKCTHDQTHRVCARLLDKHNKPLKWGKHDFWKITNQKALQWDDRMKQGSNKGDSWCICMWAFAELIEEVGCNHVHLHCQSSDLKYVMQSYKDKGVNGVEDLTAAKECLEKKCG